MSTTVKITLSEFDTAKTEIQQEFDQLMNHFDLLKQHWDGLSSVWEGESKTPYQTALENLLFRCYETAKELGDVQTSVVFARDTLVADDNHSAVEIDSLFEK